MRRFRPSFTKLVSLLYDSVAQAVISPRLSRLIRISHSCWLLGSDSQCVGGRRE